MKNRRLVRVRTRSTSGERLDWRVAWYSVILWLSAIIVGGFVVLPWFYLAMPLVVIWLTTVYFKKTDKSLRAGLWVSLVWFLIVAALDFFEIVGPYYMDANMYFSDSRNWLKYPLILLTPVVYSMLLENRKFSAKVSKSKFAPAI